MLNPLTTALGLPVSLQMDRTFAYPAAAPVAKPLW